MNLTSHLKNILSVRFNPKTAFTWVFIGIVIFLIGLKFNISTISFLGILIMFLSAWKMADIICSEGCQ